jgi:hypothetical protein
MRAAVIPGRWKCIPPYRRFLETIRDLKFHGNHISVSSSFLNSSIRLRPQGHTLSGGSNRIHRLRPLNLWKISPNVPIDAHQVVQAGGGNCPQFQSGLSWCGMGRTWVRRSRDI